MGLRPRRAATPGCSRPPAGPTCARRSSAAARCCRSTRASSRRARSAPTCRRSTRTGEAVIDEVGELVLTAADAVDAAALLGRRGRRAAPRGLLRHVTRASGATATGSGSRQRGTAVIYGRSDSTINRGGDPHGDERDLPRGARARRDRRRARGRRPAGRRGELDAAVRRAARGRRARRRPRRRDPQAGPRGLLPAPRAERGARDRRGAADAVGQGARGPGQADPHGRGAGAAPRAATRSPTPQALDTFVALARERA